MSADQSNIAARLGNLIGSSRGQRDGYQMRRRRGEAGLKSKTVKLTVILPEVVFFRLDEIRSAHNTSKQQLMLRGLDLLFADLGEPSIASLMKRTEKKE